jgi:uncharacterized protein YgbK (DUF1537 family)
MSKEDAYSINLRLGRTAANLQRRVGGRVQLVSRSDSTLRGHLRAEITALVDARVAAGGPAYDGVLLIPSYLEAGRFTAGDIQWATVDGRVLPVGDTEFAADRTFGFVHSELPRFIEEKYDGAVRAADVATLTLEDIRVGGPQRVANVLTNLPPRGATYVAVNTVDYSDLDVVTLGLHIAEAAGRSFLCRTGPSFVQALAGVDPIEPLRLAAGDTHRSVGHGLVVVGSHVGLTTRQVGRLLAANDVKPVIVDAARLSSDQAHDEIASVAERADRLLDATSVVLMTGRDLVAGTDGNASLDIARQVSAGLVEIVERLAGRRLPWMVTKGGITSHDILANALRVRRAKVIGQLFPGFVSVFRPEDARPEAIGMPCVIFAGNVGDEQSLRAAVEIVRS